MHENRPMAEGAMFSQLGDARTGKLAVLASALVYTGEGSPTLEQRRKKLPEYSTSPRRKVDLAFYEGMFNRDKPGSSEDSVPKAIAAAELPLVSEVPTGTYVDMCANLPLAKPEAIPCPTLVIRGEFDGIAAEPDLLDFFTRLPTKDLTPPCTAFFCTTNFMSSLLVTNVATKLIGLP